MLGNPVIIHTDHANLTYYRHPHKLSDRARRALNRIMKYNLSLKHKPGVLNRADALSHRPDYETHIPLQDEIGLPKHLFVNTTTALGLDHSIIEAQLTHSQDILSLTQKYLLTQQNDTWTMSKRLVVVGNNDLKRGVISLYHDFPTAGHPGQRKTLASITRDYWWPNMRLDVAEFVKGCAICQSTKPRTTQPKLLGLTVYSVTVRSYS